MNLGIEILAHAIYNTTFLVILTKNYVASKLQRFELKLRCRQHISMKGA
jgi:hypothetical protein